MTKIEFDSSYNVSHMRFSEAYLVLALDVHFCITKRNENYPKNNGVIDFWNRALVHSLFSFIEGLLFHIGYILREADACGRIRLSERDKTNIDRNVPPTFEYYGNYHKKRKHSGFADYFKFVFKTFYKYFCPINELCFQGKDWPNFLDVIEIRNRITHPKTPLDLNINDAEQEKIDQSINWLVSDQIHQIFKSITDEYETSS
jgi:hypothetical protein